MYINNFIHFLKWNYFELKCRYIIKVMDIVISISWRFNKLRKIEWTPLKIIVYKNEFILSLIQFNYPAKIKGESFLTEFTTK